MIDLKKETQDNFRALTKAINALYVGMGEDPAGRSSTKGF